MGNRRRIRWSVLMLAVTALVAGCGRLVDGSAGTMSGAEPSACARPDGPAGTETPVTTPGFVRYVAIAGRAVWVALRGGEIAKLDPFCGTAKVAVSIGTQVWPTVPAGSTDFAALVSDGHNGLWAIAEVIDQAGTPTSSAVVRVDARTESMTAGAALAPIGYSRTARGLAASGDQVWVADAQAEGTAARLDPTSAAVLGTVRTPEGAQSTNQDLGVGPDGTLWVPDGDHGVCVFDPAGGLRGAVALPAGGRAAPGILPLTGTTWITGGPARRVAGPGTPVEAVPVDLLTAGSRGVWGVASSPRNAVVHLADDATVVRTYPVPNQTVSLATTGDDVWRVDFAGVLHHLAG